MRKLALITSLITLLFASCISDTPSEQSSSSASAPTTPVDSSAPPPAREITSPAAPVPPSCQLAGEVLDGNQRWLPQHRKLIRVAATAETRDPNLGESHRSFEVYDDQCSLVFKKVLPIARSADFPYELSKIVYNKISGWLAIQGYDRFFLYNVITGELTGPFTPRFLNERYAEDAQSGRIERLEVWESYLVGYAVDEGAFVFDLSSEQPRPILPLAEFTIEQGLRYNSLFALRSGENEDHYQLLIPVFDAENRSFSINPLLDKPLPVQTNINPAFRNNRFIVLKIKSDNGTPRPLAIDMLRAKRVPLPEDIARSSDTRIIEWMRNNAN